MFIDIAVIVNISIFVFVFFEAMYLGYRSRDLTNKFRLFALCSSVITAVTSVSYIFAQLFWLAMQDVSELNQTGQYLWLLTDYLFAVTLLVYTIGTQVWVSILLDSRRLTDIAKIRECIVYEDVD